MRGDPGASGGRSTLVNVQALRFLAAAMVLFGHLEHEASGRRMGAAAEAASAGLIEWGLGVHIFFVISGFIMIYMSADQFGRPGAALEFLRRRIARVVPSYWFFTTLMLAAALAVPALVVHDTLSLPYVLASYGFVPVPRGDGAFRPVLALGWTLNYEMFFYACFAAALLLPLRGGLATLAAGFGLLVAAAAFMPMGGSPLAFWGEPIVLEFLAGIGLGLLFRRGWRAGLPLSAALGIVGFGAAMWVHRLDAPELQARLSILPALAIAAAFIFCRPAPGGRLARLAILGGDSSYALYLSHPFSISALAVVWGHLLPGHPWGFILCGLVVATACAALFHLTIERRFAEAFGGRAARRPRGVPAEAVLGLGRAGWPVPKASLPR